MIEKLKKSLEEVAQVLWKDKRKGLCKGEADSEADQTRAFALEKWIVVELYGLLEPQKGAHYVANYQTANSLLELPQEWLDLSESTKEYHARASAKSNETVADSLYLVSEENSVRKQKTKGTSLQIQLEYMLEAQCFLEGFVLPLFARSIYVHTPW